jgi:hypothetical protein
MDVFMRFEINFLMTGGTQNTFCDILKFEQVCPFTLVIFLLSFLSGAFEALFFLLVFWIKKVLAQAM